MRAGFEGGQMPLAMRIPKLRGSTSRDAMPIGPFRTYCQPVNIRDLDRFEAGDEVTPETLKAKGLIRSVRKDVKLLGVGELSKKLTITVHAASATAREKVEAAGGTLTLLKEPKARKPKNMKRRPEGRVKDSTPEAAEPEADETTEATEATTEGGE
jgi:large subunit ribosomal protein L15